MRVSWGIPAGPRRDACGLWLVIRLETCLDRTQNSTYGAPFNRYYRCHAASDRNAAATPRPRAFSGRRRVAGRGPAGSQTVTGLRTSPVQPASTISCSWCSQQRHQIRSWPRGAQSRLAHLSGRSPMEAEQLLLKPVSPASASLRLSQFRRAEPSGSLNDRRSGPENRRVKFI